MIWYKEIDFSIIKIKWERIFLEFVINTPYLGHVEFAFVKFTRVVTNEEEVQINQVEPEYDFIIDKSIPIEFDDYKDGTFHFSLNMAAVDGRDFLDNGKWRLCAFFDDGVSVVHVTNELAYKLDELCRIFRYGRGKYKNE